MTIRQRGWLLPPSALLLVSGVFVGRDINRFALPLCACILAFFSVLLLKGRFRPHHPESGYPWIEGEDASERVVAAYSDDVCVRAGAPDNGDAYAAVEGMRRDILERIISLRIAVPHGDDLAGP